MIAGQLKHSVVLLASTRGWQQGDPKASGIRPRGVKESLIFCGGGPAWRLAHIFWNLSLSFSHYPVYFCQENGVLYCNTAAVPVCYMPPSMCCKLSCGTAAVMVNLCAHTRVMSSWVPFAVGITKSVFRCCKGRTDIIEKHFPLFSSIRKKNGKKRKQYRYFLNKTASEVTEKLFPLFSSVS